MNAKKWWKAYYRLARIGRREAKKATSDMMIYGTGAVLIPDNGEAKHIPFMELYTKEHEGKLIVSDMPRLIDDYMLDITKYLPLK